MLNTHCSSLAAEIEEALGVERLSSSEQGNQISLPLYLYNCSSEVWKPLCKIDNKISTPIWVMHGSVAQIYRYGIFRTRVFK